MIEKINVNSSRVNIFNSKKYITTEVITINKSIIFSILLAFVNIKSCLEGPKINCGK